MAAVDTEAAASSAPPAVTTSDNEQYSKAAPVQQDAGAGGGADELATPTNGHTAAGTSVEDVEPAVLSQNGHTTSDVGIEPAAPEQPQQDEPVKSSGANGVDHNAGPSIEPPPKAAAGDNLVLEKFAIYKTESRLYIIASNQFDSRYRVLKIDRHFSPTDATHDLNITDDETLYSPRELQDLLNMISEGNKASGGLQPLDKEVKNFYGIVGFIRWTAGWHIVCITKRAPVALIGGHYIYHSEQCRTYYIPNTAKPDKYSEDGKLLSTFEQMDLSKNFYFSYTYDLTNTLQTNLTRLSPSSIPPSMASSNVQHVADHAFHEAPTTFFPASDGRPVKPQAAWGFNDRFVWNHFLLRTAFVDSIDLDSHERRERSCWVLPLVHGFVDQAKVSIFGRTVYVTLIARRSRYFAGARFLKRGVNDEGNVANDVESEQIVSEALTTSFYTPVSAGPDGKQQRQLNPRYTSYVQNRGSIPLSWQQDTSTTTLKPPIHLHLIDPYHSAAALHFDDLFYRYGTPIIALNLVKRKEHEARESKLIQPFKECIDYLNQFLPGEKKVRYIPFDMSAAYKNRTMDVIGVLEDIAEEVLETTHFFHSGAEPAALAPPYQENQDGRPRESTYRSTPLLQEGVCRTNCIDCLDRTNAAQFVIAKAAFGHQLHALGILSNPHLAYDNDAVNLLTEMYHDHGDTIALQYGGSHLVNTMNTYRKINQWESHSRDMVEGLKRIYANIALDQEKQNSINLFLGIDGPESAAASAAAAGATGSTISRRTTAMVVEAAATAAAEAAVGNGKTAEDQTQGSNIYAEQEKKSDLDTTSAETVVDEAPAIIRTRRDYRFWYTSEYLDRHVEPDELAHRTAEVAKEDYNYWLEYYRPKLFTDLQKHFAYNVNSTARYNAKLNSLDRIFLDPSDLSPFKGRPTPSQQPPKIGVGVRRWMSVQKKGSRELSSAASAARGAATGSSKSARADLDGTSSEDDQDEVSLPAANTTEGLALRHLRPKVQISEAQEYASYIDQFQNLNLSNELAAFESSAADLQMYEQAVDLARGGMAKVDRNAEEIYEKHCRTHGYPLNLTFADL